MSLFATSLGFIGLVVSHGNSSSSNSNSQQFNQQTVNTDVNTDDEETIDVDKDLKDTISGLGINPDDVLKETDNIDKIKKSLTNAEKELSKNNIDNTISHIAESIKTAYLADIIKDDFLDKIDKKIEKIQLILNLANGTNYDGEKETSIKKSIEMCKSTINLIKGEIYGTEQFSGAN
jgi:hypothetical protein